MTAARDTSDAEELRSAKPTEQVATARCARCGGTAVWMEETRVRRDTGEPRSILAGPGALAMGLFGLLAGGPALVRAVALWRTFHVRGDVRADVVSAVAMVLIGARAVVGAVRGWRAWERSAKDVRRRYECETCGHAWETLSPAYTAQDHV